MASWPISLFHCFLLKHNTLKQPNFLQPGDLIAVISTAFHANEQRLSEGIKLIEKAGFKVLLPQHGMKQFGALAGSDIVRLTGLQMAINNPEVKAIWFARGGYGSSRLLDRVDFAGLTALPKWFIGFSDITVFHQVLQSLEICSLHAPMVTQLAQDAKGFEATLSLLAGKLQTLIWETSSQSSLKTEGLLIGGNLSLLAHLCGSKYGLKPKEQSKILFLEEVGEKLYHIDRMLIQLKHAGQFEQVTAIVLGDFSDIINEANFPGTLLELVAYHSGLPVVDGLQSGHCLPNMPLGFGIHYELTVEHHQASLRNSTINL